MAETAVGGAVGPYPYPRLTAGIGGLQDLNNHRRQQAQAAYAKARNKAEAQRIKREFEIKERQRRAQLKKTVARERARFGARGVNSYGGSAGALISGLEKNAEQEISGGRELMGFRTRNLLEESQPQKRRSFLELRKSLAPFINLLEAY